MRAGALSGEGVVSKARVSLREPSADFACQAVGRVLTRPEVARAAAFDDEKALAALHECLSRTYKTGEKRCQDEYWSQPAQADQLKEFRAAAVGPAPAMETFAEALKQAEAAAQKTALHVVSDNPAFDFAFLNHYLDVYLGRASLAYSSEGRYRGVRDEWEVLRKVAVRHGLSVRAVTPAVRADVEAFVRERATHDHYPENDAACIYWRTVALCRTLLCEG